MSPSATFIFASPAVRPLVSVLMASARTGPAASAYPAAAAADAVMKPRRENGATFVSPTISDASCGSAGMIDTPAGGEAHSANNPRRRQVTRARRFRPNGESSEQEHRKKTRPPTQYNANGLASPGH